MSAAAPNPHATSRTVPFSALIAADDINARSATKEGLDALAASIETKGLIQPLAVRPSEQGAGGKESKFEVIDGRRRYMALALLVKTKKLPKSYAVAVLVRNETDEDALETSLMANTVRLPMHPVDQHEVFARMAGQGRSPDDIAARFGISSRTVRQQMALGALAEPIRKAWRTGKIDADVAKAYAATTDHTRQIEVFDRLNKQSHGHDAYNVRRDLNHGTQRIKATDVPQRTIDLYTQRGGTLCDDLFEDARYVAHPLLLASVRRDLAATMRAELEAEGWAWVSDGTDLPGGWQYNWDTLDVSGQGTEAEQAEKTHLANFEGGSEEENRAADTRLADIEHTITMRGCTPDLRATAGAVVWTNHDGSVEVKRGVIRPDGVAVVGTTRGGIDDDDACPNCGANCYCNGATDTPSTGATDDDSDDPYAVSGALMTDITTAQTRAAAAALRTDPALGLRVALAALSVSTWATPAKIAVTRFQSKGPGREAERDFTEAITTATDSLSDAQVISLLAHIAADSLDLIAAHPGSRRDDANALVAALPDAAYLSAIRFEFDAADYFKRATKATALAAIDEVIEAGCGAGLAPVDALADMKKGDLAAVAAERAVQCGWLPPQLRHPTYALAPPEAQRLTGKTAAAEQRGEAT